MGNYLQTSGTTRFKLAIDKVLNLSQMIVTGIQYSKILKISSGGKGSEADGQSIQGVGSCDGLYWKRF